MKRLMRNFDRQPESTKARLMLVLVTLSMFLLSAGAPAGFGGMG